jgi:hypothetical protein
MSQVTYRGVKYDTQERKARPTQQHTALETYRGVKHIEKVGVVK